jgi:hypothetical protein
MVKKYLVPEADIVYEENGTYFAVLASWVIQHEGELWIRNGVILVDEGEDEENALMTVAAQTYPDLKVIDVQWARLSEQFERLEQIVGDSMIAGRLLAQFDKNVDNRDGER